MNIYISLALVITFIIILIIIIIIYIHKLVNCKYDNLEKNILKNTNTITVVDTTIKENKIKIPDTEINKINDSIKYTNLITSSNINTINLNNTNLNNIEYKIEDIQELILKSNNLFKNKLNNNLHQELNNYIKRYNIYNKIKFDEFKYINNLIILLNYTIDKKLTIENEIKLLNLKYLILTDGLDQEFDRITKSILNYLIQINRNELNIIIQEYILLYKSIINKFILDKKIENKTFNEYWDNIYNEIELYK